MSVDDHIFTGIIVVPSSAPAIDWLIAGIVMMRGWSKRRPCAKRVDLLEYVVLLHTNAPRNYEENKFKVTSESTEFMIVDRRHALRGSKLWSSRVDWSSVAPSSDAVPTKRGRTDT